MSHIHLGLWALNETRAQRAMRRVGLASNVDDPENPGQTVWQLNKGVYWSGPFYLGSSAKADEYEIDETIDGKTTKRKRQKLKPGVYYNVLAFDTGKKKKSENPAKKLRHSNADVKYEQLEDAVDADGNPIKIRKALMDRINMKDMVSETDAEAATKGGPTQTLTAKQQKTKIAQDQKLPDGINILSDQGVVIARFFEGPQGERSIIKTPHNVFSI